MKKIVLIFLMVFIFGWGGKVEAALNDYCATPPFLTTAIKPNILFVIDKSGSMGWTAYSDAYDSSETYEGYFIPSKNYKLDNGVWTETSDPENCTFTQTAEKYVGDREISGVCSGSKLNFATMARVDLLRWAITGGRPEACDGTGGNDAQRLSTDCDPDLACTGDYCVLETNADVKVKVPKSRIDGLVQNLRAEKEDNQPRLGVLFYSSDIYSHRVYIGDYPDGDDADANYPYTYFTRFINNIAPGGGTGTAPAMWEAYDYFKQQNDHNYNNGFALHTNDSNKYRDPLYICDASRTNCELVPCAKNFVILASDGQWNRGGSGPEWTCSIDEGYENYSADPVVPAYRMHTDVLRTVDDVDIKVNKVYSLGLFLGGTGELSLKNVAMYGAFDVSTGTWPDSLSDYPLNYCYMDDCGNGRGSACTNLPSSSYDWDQDGDNNPDTFFNAKTASELKDTITAFIQEILKEASSGTSVSVLSEKRKQGSLIHQAVFYPQKRFYNSNGTKKVEWTGELYSYWFYNTSKVQNIREDTNQDKILETMDDNILTFSVNDQTGQLYIDVYNSSSNGSADTKVNTYYSLDDIKALIDVGDTLKDTDSADRKIYVAYSDSNMTEFTTSNKAQFSSYLYSNSSTLDSCLTSSGNPVDNIINYIRGTDISGCRSRDTGSGTWKLGDIIYSTPAVVTYGQYGVVFAGANDGMLHAFQVGKIRADNLTQGQLVKICDDNSASCTTVKLGKELWAFIPKNALPYLRWLAHPDYAGCHNYFVDMPPYIFTLGDKAILVGGMRLGGACGNTADSEIVNPPSDTCSDPSSSNCVGRSSYFALDITDAENPKFLWEFSHPYLGFSYSGPAHIKYLDKHYVMFASGPTNYRGESKQGLRLFVLKLKNDGTIDQGYPKIIDSSVDSVFSPFNNSFGGRLFTEGIDYNQDGSTDFVYLGVSTNNGGVWQGNVLMVKITNDDPTKWTYVKVFNSAIEPVISKVEYMRCFDMNYIYFGTGRWFYKEDEPGQNSNDIEHLYGVRIDDCIQNNNCNINSSKNSNEVCTELVNNNNLSAAWKLDLDPAGGGYYKERMISDPALGDAYNLVFFSTTEPNGDPCSFGGRSRLWGLNCATGGSLTSSCNGQYEPETFNQVVLLQLSKGNIEGVGGSDFGSNGASAWFTGITPETAPIIPPPPVSVRSGEILLWIEK